MHTSTHHLAPGAAGADGSEQFMTPAAPHPGAAPTGREVRHAYEASGGWGVTMLLADEFYFLGIDDRTGRSHLAPRVFGLGLAGGLLGELILERKIHILGDQLEVVDRYPPADALSRKILEQLTSELTDYPIRTWLVFLAQQAREQVAQRLWRARQVHQQTVRRLWRSETLYPPVDVNTAAWPRARLANALDQHRPMTWPDVLLAGLAVATGLDGHMLEAAGPSARDYLQHLVQHLPRTVHELVWHLHAAVGDAVLTGRT